MAGGIILALERQGTETQLLQGIFKREEHRIIFVSTTAHACEVLSHQSVDVVVAGASADDGNTTTFLRSVRNKEGNGLPAIILLTDDQSMVHRASLQKIYDVVIPKPLNPAQLRQAVNALIGFGRRAQKEIDWYAGATRKVAR